MMEFIWGSEKDPLANQVLEHFVCSMIPDTERGFGQFVSMGVVDRGTLIAAVIYHNFFPEQGVIELSASARSKRWLTRPVIREMFNYPFNQLGCQMVVLKVAESNKSMVAIAERFGFEAHRIPRLHGRDEAEIIFTLTDDAWRVHPANRG